MNAIESSGLAKRYGSAWALRDCNLAIPVERTVALVGPNGAGKTTFLHCVVGLVAPTAGRVTVLDGLVPGSVGALERVSFVAQDAPLYRHLAVSAMLAVASNLNRRFDRDQAEDRIASFGIDLRQKIGRLSGGQQAQVAIAVALARQADLLVLDEPMARLDPLARHEFMALVMTAMADGGLSVVFSSHVISELERVADYLVVISGGRVQVAGDIDQLLSGHAIWRGPTEDVSRIAELAPVVHVEPGRRQTNVVVRSSPASESPAGWEREGVSLEELVLAYLRESSMSALPGPSPLGAMPLDAASAERARR